MSGAEKARLQGISQRIFLAAVGISLPFSCAFAQSAHLVPHKATYELKLGKSGTGSPVSNVAGRILFQTTGNACTGYDTEFHFLAAITDSGNNTNTTDLTSKTHESPDGKSFSFSSRTETGGKLESQFDGKAELKDGKTAINLTKPDTTDFSFDQELVFPNLHMNRLVSAALAGQSVLPAAIYDASNPVDKAYRTISVIGAKITTDLTLPPDTANAGTANAGAADVAAGNAALKGHAHWPVVVSYFPLTSKDDSSPDHIITFDLLDNGVSGKMLFDYGDFTIEGQMSSLELLPDAPCAPAPVTAAPTN